MDNCINAARAEQQGLGVYADDPVELFARLRPIVKMELSIR
jgi:hypothetical protein